MKDGDKIAELSAMEAVPDEGGSFVRTYTGKTDSASGEVKATSILYLLRGTEVSRWHKLSCDEIWFYHSGTSARQLLLFPDGSWCERIMGDDLLHGEQLQSVIPAGTWQSTVLTDRSEASLGLFGTVCVPGFEYAKYTGGNTAELIGDYPEAAEKIRDFGSIFPKMG